jgi:hypothetical protein
VTKPQPILAAAAEPCILRLDGAAVDLQAAAAGKLPRVVIHAYGGGEFRPDGLGPTVIDLNGVSQRKQIVFLAAHDPKAILGHADKVSITSHGIDAEGPVSGAGPARDEFLVAAKNGLPYSASVGMRILQQHRLRPGEAADVNGRRLIAGPEGLRVVDRSELYEISILAIGADEQSSVDLAAKQVINGGITMTPEEEKRIREAERARLAAIETACRGLEAVPAIADLRAKAIAGEIGVEVLQAQALDTWAKRDELAQVRASRAPIPATTEHGRQDVTTVRAVTEANLLLAMGRADLVAKLAPAIAERARKPRHALDWCVSVLEAERRDVPEGRNELIRAAFSTNLATEAFTSSAQRIAVDAFQVAPPSILKIAAQKDLKNFLPTDVLRPILGGQFNPVAINGELKHAVADEATYDALQASTYGQLFGLDRQDVINDSLGVIPQLVGGLVRNGSRLINDVGWSVVMANASSFFSSTNGNYLTTNALSYDNLSAAIKAFRAQTDKLGRPIDIIPKTLAVPPALEMMGAALLKSTTLARDTSTDSKAPTANPLQGILDLLVEPRLENAKYTGHSALAYYLFAAPVDGALILGFVNGQSSPIIEQVTPGPEYLGIMFRGYVDVAAAYGTPQAAWKGKGEA